MSISLPYRERITMKNNKAAVVLCLLAVVVAAAKESKVECETLHIQ